MDQLRAAAVNQTLFAPTTLRAAIRRLGFVQADPIRAPARAQDLILRHRVKNYVAGDLERKYATLRIDENLLYAYGFLPSENLALLRPKASGELSAFEENVLAVVREHGPLHPSDLHTWFGRDRVINAWGGYSKATKRTLEQLHERGLLRIARRDAGIRVYESVDPAAAASRLTDDERMRGAIRLVAGILSPVPERTLSAIAARLARPFAEPAAHRSIMRQMVSRGELVQRAIDGMTYLWLPGRRSYAESRIVRLLAPFDPVVWDRRRFAHIWGWEYRFEAYTPVAKRLRGYYALPLLWGSRVIGWANVRLADNDVDMELGFAGTKPRDPEFKRELAHEIERLREMLTGASRST